MDRGGFSLADLRSLRSRSHGVTEGVTDQVDTCARIPCPPLTARLLDSEQIMTRNMEPSEAVERFLKEREPEVAQSTHHNQTYRLKRFVEWCDETGVKDITELDAFDVHDFKIHRRESAGINEVTLRNHLYTLRVFLRWCESVGLIKEDIAENLLIPKLEDGTRDAKISPETAEAILGYLKKFEYASKKHAIFSLLWDTGFRLGTSYTLDLGDYHTDEQYLEVHHRPEIGTPLKNKERGEREVNLHGWVCDVLDDYIKFHRHNVRDEHGREPLFTSKHGRASKSGLRPLITGFTRPCVYSDVCPHDRVIEGCEAAKKRIYAARCPTSISPHAIRRSAITAWLNEGHRKELILDRMDVSTKTLDKHYDARTESEKRELRREAFGMAPE